MKLQGKYLSVGREEKIILGLLSHYGALKVDQIARYLPYMSRDTTNRLIERMICRRFIYRCGSLDFETADELTVNPTEKLTIVNNQTMQRAFWILIDFMENGRTTGKAHSVAEYPSQMMIISNNDSIYEVVVVDEDDEVVTSRLVYNHHQEQAEVVGDEQNNVKYIVVISNPAQIPKINIPNLHTFALVDEATGKVKYLRATQRR